MNSKKRRPYDSAIPSEPTPEDEVTEDLMDNDITEQPNTAKDDFGDEQASEQIQKLLTVVEQLNKELEATKEQLTRAHADAQNANRRLLREAQNLREQAAEDIVKRLLPVLDNFERTIEAAESGASLEAVLEGVKLIDKQIRTILDSYHVKPIQALGARFDPEFHEVVFHEPSEHEDETVIEEIEKGYTIGEKVLRPSKVKVSKGNSV